MIPKQENGMAVTCCKEMGVRLQSNDLQNWDGTVYIFGRPRFAYDGEGHYDDTTREIEIKYCPWCGKDLSGLRLPELDFPDPWPIA